MEENAPHRATRYKLKEKDMKKRIRKFDPSNGFEIKKPIWAFWVCLSVSIASLAAFFLFLILKAKALISYEDFWFGFGFLFLTVALISLLGVYVCIFEKLSFSKGVYTYCNAFGKAKKVHVSELSSVKLLKVYYHTRYGIKSKQRVFFYGKSKSLLIKIIDDGTLTDNEVFIKSLKYHRIKIIREEKFDY